MKLIEVCFVSDPDDVAPLAGAWIEIRKQFEENCILTVAPLAGAWIEMSVVNLNEITSPVAPLAGAWIEMDWETFTLYLLTSLPLRERGLKFNRRSDSCGEHRRSPCGSGD